MSQLSIRPARLDESAALADLVNSAYRGESSKQGWTTEADLLGGRRADTALLEQMISAPTSVVLVCLQDGRLAGCVHLERHEHSVYLGMLTVRPDLQAAGVGRRLLAEAEAWVTSRFALHAIEMKVIRQRTELIAWYLRRGYADTGRRVPFPADDRLAIHKVSDLEMVVLSKTLPATR